jgi:tRNA pseudouridine38-40 synthase
VATALVLSYDGSRFHGAAPQPGMRTVVGTVSVAIATVVQAEARIQIAGRTDAGVHARAQVLAVDKDVTWLNPRRLEKLCAPGIGVRAVYPVEETFSPRADARYRQYLYRIRTAFSDPLDGFSWCVGIPIDVAVLRDQLSHFVGAHMFTALCKANSAGGFFREVLGVEVYERPGYIDVMIAGRSFCHQMVRRMVGSAVAVACGRLSPAGLQGAFANEDRGALSYLAPAKGLFLWRVGFNHLWREALESYGLLGFEAEWSIFPQEGLDFRVE